MIISKIISRILFASFSIFVSNTVVGQQKGDSTQLPFAIDAQKELPAEDLKDKKEGWYVTGIPDISSDPVNGFGYGGEGSVYFNGKRSDPFFKYTAYRTKIDFVLFMFC